MIFSSFLINKIIHSKYLSKLYKFILTIFIITLIININKYITNYSNYNKLLLIKIKIYTIDTILSFL